MHGPAAARAPSAKHRITVYICIGVQERKQEKKEREKKRKKKKNKLKFFRVDEEHAQREKKARYAREIGATSSEPVRSRFISHHVHTASVEQRKQGELPAATAARQPTNWQQPTTPPYNRNIPASARHCAICVIRDLLREPTAADMTTAAVWAGAQAVECGPTGGARAQKCAGAGETRNF